MATLIDKINAYLLVNNLGSITERITVIEPDVILTWDPLFGREPFLQQLDEAFAASPKAKAMEILAATDWVTMADVTTGTHKLTNQAEFIEYRDKIRIIALNPTANVVWPTMPTESWSS